MRLIPVTEIQNGRRFPRYINPDHVMVLNPGVPRPLIIDGSEIQAQTTIVHFVGGGPSMLVQGWMEEVAERIEGVS